MSKERLSRLQKWILVCVYVNVSEMPMSMKRITEYCRIGKALDGKPATKCKDRPALDVTVSRAVWGLSDKGLLDVYGEVAARKIKSVLSMPDQEWKKGEKAYFKSLIEGKKANDRVPLLIGRGTGIKAKFIVFTVKGLEKGAEFWENREKLNVKKHLNNKKCVFD